MVSEDLIGATIGPYTILEKIGQGGMAEVYKGRHVGLQRLVAIKFLGRALDIDERVTQRFQREAQAIAAMRHPNIVQVHDFGSFEGGHYLVMEYVEGTDLRQEMNRRAQENHPFTPDEIINLARQIAFALDYAHEQGVIHRDVKPGNILITRDGQAILGDFGLVMLRNRISQATLGTTFGTPEYIAPEQATDSRAAVPQSDIYALGGVIYEMVTGELPFEADSAISLALKHIQEDPIPPRRHNPRLPQAVEDVILRALAKNPRQRYATAQEFVDALQQAWRTGTPPPAVTPSAFDETLVSPAAVTKRRKRWLPLLIGLIVVGGVALGGYFILRGGTLSLMPAATETPTSTASLTAIPTTATPVPTSTPPSTPTASPTEQPTPTSTSTLSPTSPPSVTPTPSPTATPNPSPTATSTATPTPTLAPGAVLTREVDGMTLRFVPESPFLMGAPEDDEDARDHEKPQHEVLLSAFWMDETEVTTDQYKQCVEAEACEAPYTRTAYDNPRYGDHPMTYISWEEAVTYCQWLADETGWNVSLPTEAQWEKAASWDPATATKRRYPWGDEMGSSYAHIGGATASVGQYPQGTSAYGVLDLAGNVWEWVSDWYDKDYYATEALPADPTGPATGQYRVFRGGNYDSWGNSERQLRTTHRDVGAPASASDRPAKGPGLGFRCVVNEERLP
ncbi:MAG: SUMF1/EgtB/PvdO family nonheme iron enzyme [Anaerolineae bacterium]|nr:SUMF1/EgtB/PvdO family nonheme iron enzyme [Anaerolineae bacterium]